MLKIIENFYNRLQLTQQFMLISLIILIIGMLGIGGWIGHQIKNGILNHAGATTALYLDSFVAPLLQDLAHSDTLSQENIEILSNVLNNTPLGQHVVSFKVWDPSGKLLYSTDQAEIGTIHPMTDRLSRASNGEVNSEISLLDDEENADLGAIYPSLLETYSPIRLMGTNQVIAVAEFYEALDDLQEEITLAQRNSWLVVGISMLVIYLLLSGFVRGANNIIEGQRAELNAKVTQLSDLLAQNQELNERVRRAAASVTTLNEQYLRRIGSELHDGPLQDLGLALLNLDAVIANCETQDECAIFRRNNIESEKIEASLQNAMKEIRSISSGLSLPHLNDLSLDEVVSRAVRTHMRRTGTRVELKTDKLPEQSTMPVKITVYRLLQEALNNAFHHAGGIGQKVTVSLDNASILVKVSDQGCGFDINREFESNGHLGLVGMRERIESLGGYFEIESSTGKGTRITAQLPIQATWRQE